MKIDFSEVKSQLDKLANEAEPVVAVYQQAEWEDEVQASYKPYISECNDLEGQVDRIKNTLGSIESLAGNIEESSDVKHELDCIKSQADAIVV